MFEDLALADYGSRIPSLTFELIADGEPPRVAAIITDVSRGMIEDGDEAATVTGFAALGSDRRSAIEPLLELWGGAYHDDGVRIRAVPSSAAPIIIDGTERMGCSADGEQGAAVTERRQEAADALPTVLTIEYYDPLRDFQAGQMRASLGSGGRSQRRIDSAAALMADVAKSQASDALTRRWAGRDRLTLRLAPTFLDMRPGQLVALLAIPGLYRVEDVAIEGMVVIIQTRRTHRAGATLVADPGRPVVEPDLAIGRSAPLLLDLPTLALGVADGFGVVLALGCTGAFKPTMVEVSANSQPLARLAVARPATTGRGVTILAAGYSQLTDRINAVEVQCIDPDARLLHADADALAMGANAAMLGAELIQYARADALGGGLYRLSDLLRGCRATEWAMAGHAVDEPFVMLDAQRLAFVAMDRAMIGARVEARAYGIADDQQDPPLATVTAGGENLRPLSPCHLRGEIGASGLTLSWVPRRVEALRWVTGADPDTTLARYVVTLSRGDAPVTRESGTATLALSPAELAALGSGPLSIALSETGVGGTSRPALLSIAA